MTRLIGRERDVALVLDLLVNPDVRMVTIVGPGGIGKSRLALAVAEGARERCPDGISYIDLAPLTEPSLVLPTIAKSLGIEEQAGTSVGGQLRDRLDEARMMIVLDNMEQLAEAASEVSDLLEATQALVLLVTSRRLLDVRGERIYTLGPLAVPADEAVTAAGGAVLGAGSEHPPRVPAGHHRGLRAGTLATAELRDGRAERAGQLYALAERGYRQAGYQLWRTDAEEHRQFDTELRAALGDRYEEVLAQSHTIDLDRAIDELVESDPAAQALRHRISLVAADR